MSIQQLLYRSSDASLEADRRHYQQAIAQERMPTMLFIWQETLTLIEAELAHRQQRDFTRPSNQPINVPF